MRKNMTLPALTVVLLAAPAAADHIYVDTDTLYGWCKPFEIGDIGRGPLGAGYINGGVDILTSGESTHHQRACVPHNLSLGDVHELVIGEIDKLPKGSVESADKWVAEVLTSAFPLFPPAGSKMERSGSSGLIMADMETRLGNTG
jgi:hypothetical protein